MKRGKGGETETEPTRRRTTFLWARSGGEGGEELPILGKAVCWWWWGLEGMISLALMEGRHNWYCAVRIDCV